MLNYTKRNWFPVKNIEHFFVGSLRYTLIWNSNFIRKWGERASPRGLFILKIIYLDTKDPWGKKLFHVSYLYRSVDYAGTCEKVKMKSTVLETYSICDASGEDCLDDNSGAASTDNSESKTAAIVDKIYNFDLCPLRVQLQQTGKKPTWKISSEIT